MMKALSNVAIASESPLYQSSSAATPDTISLATYELPIVVVKDVAFFNDNLQLVGADDGTACFQWNHQKPTARVEDTAHGQFELACYASIYEDKTQLDLLNASHGQASLGITPTGLAFFANTLLHRMVSSDVDDGLRVCINNSVDGSKDCGPGNNSNSGGCTGFLPLTRAQPAVWATCRDATYLEPSFLTLDTHAALLRYRQYR